MNRAMNAMIGRESTDPNFSVEEQTFAMRIVTLILVKIAILVDFGTGLGASYRPERLCQWLQRSVNEYLTVKDTKVTI